MSTQKELAKWNDAYQNFSKGNCNASLELYKDISYLSKISFNMGSIYTYLNDYNSALECFNASIEADNYLLIALFQRGNCYFATSRLQEAANDYTRILTGLTDSMDYTQLGIEYELYRAEVLFNRSLCYMGLGMKREWQSDILQAKQYAGSMHQDAIQSHGLDSRIFMVKTGLQFQIPTWKLQSSKTWLTNAKSVHKTGFLGFLGTKVFDSTKESNENSNIGHNFGTKVLPEIHSAPQDQTVTYPLHPQNETGEKMIYVAQFLDHSASNTILTTLGIFQKKEKAVEACKNYVNTLMGGPVDELSPLDWMKGWSNGVYTVLISAQEMYDTPERNSKERESLTQ